MKEFLYLQSYIAVIICELNYHIEKFIKGNVKCNIESIKLDDIIIFHVLENRRSIQSIILLVEKLSMNE